MAEGNENQSGGDNSGQTQDSSSNPQGANPTPIPPIAPVNMDITCGGDVTMKATPGKGGVIMESDNNE